MPWEEVEHGWLATHPSESAITAARLQRFAKDSHHPNLFEQAEGNDRWCGDLAELGFENWLANLRLPFRHNGGVDSLPDFVVAGVGVGVKCRTASTSFHPHFVVNVPDEHMRRRAGEEILFFAAYEEKPNRLLLLGCLSRGRFEAKATRTAANERLHQGLSAAANACWSVEAGELAPPAEFIRYLRTRVAA